MSDYGEQIRSDLEKMINILRKEIGWLFGGGQEAKMKELVLYDYDNNKTKTGVDLNNLDDVLRIDIHVISGDEMANITYKNGKVITFDGTTEPRLMNFDDGEYCIYQAGVKNDIDEWIDRKNSYDW